MKVEVDVLGSPSLTVLMVSVDVQQCGRTAALNSAKLRARDLCESRGGRPGLPPSLIILMVSVDVKHH